MHHSSCANWSICECRKLSADGVTGGSKSNSVKFSPFKCYPNIGNLTYPHFYNAYLTLSMGWLCLTNLTIIPSFNLSKHCKPYLTLIKQS